MASHRLGVYRFVAFRRLAIAGSGRFARCHIWLLAAVILAIGLQSHGVRNGQDATGQQCGGSNHARDGALKALLHMVCVHAAFSISRKQTRHTMARLRV